MKLQKQRGFVPSKTEPEPSHIRFIDPEDDDPEENICLSGFVPSKTPCEVTSSLPLVAANLPNGNFEPEKTMKTNWDMLDTALPA